MGCRSRGWPSGGFASAQVSRARRPGARPGRRRAARVAPLNILAHALLADQAGCSLVGNLLGDFVRGAPPADWPLAWQHGIRLHRRIDGFVDRHGASARSVARLAPQQRRWARVALDVYYDHLLARDWARYSGVPLARFAAGVYADLEQHRPALPAALARFAGFMTERDLLVGYRDPAVIEEVLMRMAGRARRPNTLDAALPGLAAAQGGIAHDLAELFPATLAFARCEVAARNAPPAG